MSIQILMPALSPTMTEGNLVKWHKKEGDIVKSGQLLAEIETDKATMEVEAVDEGILAKIIIPEGTENVKVNTLIGILAEKGEDISSIAIPTESGAPNTPPPSVKTDIPAPNVAIPVAQPLGGRIIASPLAKRIAKNNSVDLHQVQGTGPHGRIIKTDVENFKPQSTGNASPLPSSGAFEDKSLSNMRKVIAQRLTESKQTIPHFYLNADINLDRLLELRTQINQALDPVKISVNDLLIKAFALSLTKISQANVMWMGTSLRFFNTVDISVAVAIPGGLITPVIRNAELKSLKEISVEMKELAQRARDGKLKPEEYQGGCMTISNLGMYGIDSFSAIVNPPQSGILAVGAAKEQAIVEKGEIKIASILKATLSVDHRAIDGAVGAELLKAIKDLLENPLAILV